MAVAVIGMACRARLSFPRPLIHCFRKTRRCSSVSVESPANTWDAFGEVWLPTVATSKRESRTPQWKRMNSKDLGIKTSFISAPAKFVLRELKKKGYDVYLVGGCVRDMLLKKTPKDFDIITSADLKEVLETFPRSHIVGKQFPVCLIHVKDTTVEVSSFATSGRKLSRNMGHVSWKPPGCDGLDYIRWKNCSQRDFTVNGLMFDPCAELVFDYFDGLKDVRNAMIRTMIPADISFTGDCARILRAFRIAARLGFRFSKEITSSIKTLSWSVLRLNRGRIFMEMNYMLGYGSAQSSLRLLWRHGLLDLILPFQAAYFVSIGFRRRDKRSNMLLSLFSQLDKLVAPDKPCHGSLWVAILAFHKALAGRPRDPLVVAAFSLSVYSGGSLLESMKIARSARHPCDANFHELLECQDLDTDELAKAILDLSASVRFALCEMTDEYSVSRAMSKYPKAPHSELVFISSALSSRVSRMFECVGTFEADGPISIRAKWIEYESLAAGTLQEVRRLFARVVFDTVYPCA